MTQAFLISTTHYLLALLEDGQFRKVHSGSGIYFGIARRAGRIYLGCQHQPARNYDEALASQQFGSILIFDEATLCLAGELKPDFAMRDIHGIAVIRDRLWVTCPFDNMVAVYDFETDTWTRWYPAPDPYLRDKDTNHFNGVFEIDGQLCLTAHHPAPSQFLFYDSESLELDHAIRIGLRAHDAFLLRGALATCSSDEGVLLNTAGWRLRTGGFPRGVAITETAILLGISTRAPRADRAKTSSIARLFDGQWTHVADYLLKEAGMIFSIMPIDASRADEGLAVWTDWERSDGYHANTGADNRYALWMENVEGLHTHEWYREEPTFRWMAARRAGIDIIRNPGERKLAIAMQSHFPGRYQVEITLAGIRLGTVEIPQPGAFQMTFEPPAHITGLCTLDFRVPHLWSPRKHFAGNVDERLLGICVECIELS